MKHLQYGGSAPPLPRGEVVPDPSILARSEKYILAGHGTLIKENYTIVPENEEITISDPEDSSDFGINPSELFVKKEAQL